MVGRPYHSDPGLNHGIPEEFQVLGYPILSVRSLPRDPAYLRATSRTEIARGQHPLDINDVWPENYSANSAQKVWAVKFAARHPNVALLDLSSFKCGHDAPTYGIIDSIVTASATPYAALHDIDANKPGGSIKIRVKTYAHTLKLHEERLEDAGRKRTELQLSIDRKRLELLRAEAGPARGPSSERPGPRRADREPRGAARGLPGPGPRGGRARQGPSFNSRRRPLTGASSPSRHREGRGTRW
jgi:hypothetical protein